MSGRREQKTIWIAWRGSTPLYSPAAEHTVKTYQTIIAPLHKKKWLGKKRSGKNTQKQNKTKCIGPKKKKKNTSIYGVPKRCLFDLVLNAYIAFELVIMNSISGWLFHSCAIWLSIFCLPWFVRIIDGRHAGVCTLMHCWCWFHAQSHMLKLPESYRKRSVLLQIHAFWD